MRDVVVIEDSTIASMINDQAFTSAIPCLQNQAAVFANANNGCGACARRRQEAQRQAIASIKSCLAGLSEEKRQELKTLLDAKQVKLLISSATGQVSTVVF